MTGEKPIVQRLINILQELGYETKNVSRKTILEDLGMDSLGGCDFTYYVEKEFNVKIPEKISFEFTTVGNYAEYLENPDNYSR
jgi:acyl carrier protein